jgi:hypothetical protein
MMSHHLPSPVVRAYLSLLNLADLALEDVTHPAALKIWIPDGVGRGASVDVYLSEPRTTSHHLVMQRFGVGG